MTDYESCHFYCTSDYIIKAGTSEINGAVEWHASQTYANRLKMRENRAETTSLSSAVTSLPSHVTEVILSRG